MNKGVNTQGGTSGMSILFLLEMHTVEPAALPVVTQRILDLMFMVYVQF